MCYAKPGPRCRSHARKALTKNAEQLKSTSHEVLLVETASYEDDLDRIGANNEMEYHLDSAIEEYLHS